MFAHACNLTCVLLDRKGDRIYHQLRKSGCSLDWSRTFFTMDEVGVSFPSSSPLHPSLSPPLALSLHYLPFFRISLVR